jgi:ligated ion channel-like protein
LLYVKSKKLIFKVCFLILKEAPYLMYKNNQNLSNVSNLNYSNSDFEGFCVDLLDELSRALKFRYKIKPITTLRYDDMVEEIKNKVKNKCL